MRRGIAFLLTIALLMGAFAAMGEGEAGGATAQESTEAESGFAFQVVPYGQSCTLETEVNADGTARREAGPEPFETLSFTLKVIANKSPDYFLSQYGTQYKLNGNEAVVQFEITLNDYDGDLEIIPQNALDFVLMGEATGAINYGFQLMDAEISGAADVTVAPDTATMLYKRYEYDAATEPMRYLLVIAHVGGEQIFYWFDTGSIVEWNLSIGSEGEEVSRLQSALIDLGILRGEPDGEFGSDTAEAVNIVQERYGMEQTGAVNRALLEHICWDAAVEKAIREQLGRPEGDIDPSELEGITKLDLSDRDIRIPGSLSKLPNLAELNLSYNSISDLSGLTNLTVLDLRGDDIKDISGLSELSNLTELDLSGNRINDLSGLSKLVNLTELDLSGSFISDISALSGLTNLTELDLSDNLISDISALSGLTDLTKLDLGYNKISDIEALRPLTRLTDLNLYSNDIRELGVLKGLGNLTALWLGDNLIDDISTLRWLTNLNNLDLENNMIDDISALRGLTKLESLDLSNNMIDDISILRELMNLNHLDLSDNKVDDLSALRGLTKLESLYLSDNKIGDIDALSGLTKLESLYLNENMVSDIRPLSGLINIIKLDLYDNLISDISALSGLTNLSRLNYDTGRIKDLSPILARLDRITLNQGMSDMH